MILLMKSLIIQRFMIVDNTYDYYIIYLVKYHVGVIDFYTIQINYIFKIIKNFHNIFIHFRTFFSFNKLISTSSLLDPK